MKKNYSHITICIDRSGSMQSMASEVISGFNNLLKEQLEVEGTATMSVVQFNSNYELIRDFVPIKKVSKLSIETFRPSGNTALLDAMGKTMENVRSKIKSMKEDDKPEKAIFVFITDGEENSSKDYTKARVFEMISDLKDKDRDDEIDWDFVFIGANQDAIAEGGAYGIRANASLTYSASGDGATMAFNSLSRGLTSYRVSSKGTDYGFSDEDRQKQEKLIKK